MTEEAPSRRERPARREHQTSRRRRLSPLAKGAIGLIGPATAIIGTLLALGIIEPFGGGENVLAAAAVQTEEAGSARLIINVSRSSPRGLEKVRSIGTVDFQTGQGRFTAHVTPPARARQEPFDIEQITDFTVFYLRFPPSVMPLPGRRQWLKIDSERLTVEQQIRLGALNSAQNDPSQYLAFLESSGSVEEVDREAVFGIETTHYRATVELEKLVEQASAEERERLRTNAAVLKPFGVETVPVDAWIDGRGLVRRLDIELPLGQDKWTYVVEASQFGTPVAVKPPPASQVADLVTLLAGRAPASAVPRLRPRPTSSRAAWIERMNAVCARALVDARKLGEPETFEEALRILPSLIAIADRVTREVAAIPPPGGAEDESAELVRLSAEEDTVARMLLVAIRFGEPTSAQRLVAKLEALGTRSNRLARELGAAKCAESQ
jgi:hypothetical protein